MPAEPSLPSLTLHISCKLYRWRTWTLSEILSLCNGAVSRAFTSFCPTKLRRSGTFCNHKENKHAGVSRVSFIKWYVRQKWGGWMLNSPSVCGWLYNCTPHVEVEYGKDKETDAHRICIMQQAVCSGSTHNKISFSVTEWCYTLTCPYNLAGIA